MEANVNRVRRDLDIIEKAMGRGPEFGKAHVYAGFGWGAAGICLALTGAFPTAVPYPWGSTLFIGLLVGLPSLLSKTLAGKWVLFPFDNNTLLSGSFALIATAAIAPAIFWWFVRIGLPATQLPAVALVIGGLVMQAYAFGKHWRLGLFVASFALIAAGLAFPFLPKVSVWPITGIALMILGFGGAAILNAQLKAHGHDQQNAN